MGIRFNRIRSTLLKKEDRDSAIVYLKYLKRVGYKQDFIYRILDSIVLKEEFPENRIDFFLDLMDIVYGFCHDNDKIWEGVLSS